MILILIALVVFEGDLTFACNERRCPRRHDVSLRKSEHGPLVERDVCPVDRFHEGPNVLVIDPEECIDCGACEPECPVEAIFEEDAVPDEWQKFIKINYDFFGREYSG